MSGWELVEVTNSSCDECGIPAACNVYRKPFGCNCAKCKEIKGRYSHNYTFIHICGYCMGKWLKTNGQFKVLDE